MYFYVPKKTIQTKEKRKKKKNKSQLRTLQQTHKTQNTAKRKSEEARGKLEKKMEQWQR
jgi:hypothetical protein